MIELPTMGVDPDKLRDGIKFFESAGSSFKKVAIDLLKKRVARRSL